MPPDFLNILEKLRNNGADFVIIAMKRKAGRPHDLDDVEALESIRRRNQP